MEIQLLEPQAQEIGAIEAISRAEIDMQVSTAKKYPRQLSAVKSSMLSFATLDEETAESCFYSLPRGGKKIEGPSVRLAEIALSCYGNLRAGTRIIETVSGGPAPHVVIQAVCHDLEKNVAISVEKRRRIVGKKSKGGEIDEDDINLAANAGSAIAFRDAVYKVVPLALIKPCYEAAKKVAIGDAKTLADRRTRALESFAKMGVAQDRVLAMLKKSSIDEIIVSDLEILFGLHTAIRDGQTTIDEAFPAAPSEPEKPKFSVPQQEAPPAAAPTPEPEKQAAKDPEKRDPLPGEPTNQKKIADLLQLCGFSEAQLFAVLKKRFAVKSKSIAELDDVSAEDIIANWSHVQGLIEEGDK